MDINTTRIRELLDQRDAIDKELQAIFTGDGTRKPQKCGTCGQEGHSARTCPRRPPGAESPRGSPP